MGERRGDGELPARGRVGARRHHTRGAVLEFSGRQERPTQHTCTPSQTRVAKPNGGHDGDEAHVLLRGRPPRRRQPRRVERSTVKVGTGVGVRRAADERGRRTGGGGWSLQDIFDREFRKARRHDRGRRRTLFLRPGTEPRGRATSVYYPGPARDRRRLRYGYTPVASSQLPTRRMLNKERTS